MPSPKVQCPFCRRTITAAHQHYTMHGIKPDSDNYCPMSRQPLPAAGHTDHDYERRARTITRLATQLRDEDPQLVYTYLQSQSHAELLQLASVALAAINTEQTRAEMFRWVLELPEARYA